MKHLKKLANIVFNLLLIGLIWYALFIYMVACQTEADLLTIERCEKQINLEKNTLKNVEVHLDTLQNIIEKYNK